MKRFSRKSASTLLIAGMVLLCAPHSSMAQDVPQGVPELLPQPQDAPVPIPMDISSPAVPGVPQAPAGDPAVPVPPDATVGATTPAGADPNAINPSQIPSILFTYWEHTAIADAKNSRGETREVTDEELMRDLRGREVDKPKPPPEEREITLEGIVYVNGDDWTIWLNNKRVTPNAIPREVMDLKVYKEYIEMKWFDDYTNQIFPIRMRTHQRFNIDSRIFLPG
jgi:hypothetical protein